MLRSTRIWLSVAAGKLFPTPVARYWAVTAWLLILGTPALATAPPAPPNRVKTTNNFSHTTPFPISLGATPTVTSTLVVSGVDAYLWDLDLTTFIVHTGARDLDLTLTSPAETIVTFTTDNGSNRDDVFNGILWDDDDANPAGQVPYASNKGLVTDQVHTDTVCNHRGGR